MQNDQTKNGQPVSVGSTGGSAFCVYQVRDLQAYGYGPRGYEIKGEFSTILEALDFMDDKPGCWDRKEKWSYNTHGNHDWICKQMQKPCPKIIGDNYRFDHMENLLTRRDLPNVADEQRRGKDSV